MRSANALRASNWQRRFLERWELVYLMDLEIHQVGGDDLKPCGKPMGTFVMMMIQSAQFDASIYWQSNLGSDLMDGACQNVTTQILLDYLEPVSILGQGQAAE